MKYFVVKVKNEDLFFNVDMMEGEFMCPMPILLDKFQADETMDSINSFPDSEIYHYEDINKVYSKDEIEVREVHLNLI